MIILPVKPAPFQEQGIFCRGFFTGNTGEPVFKKRGKGPDVQIDAPLFEIALIIFLSIWMDSVYYIG